MALAAQAKVLAAERDGRSTVDAWPIKMYFEFTADCNLHCTMCDCEMLRDRHVPLTALRGLLERCGFENLGSFVPVDAAMQGEAYLDPRGPLQPEWRKGDSLWTTLSPERLSQVCDRIREMDDAGQLEAFVREHDATRQEIGQMTFLHARRI